jgi:hypothetical protein
MDIIEQCHANKMYMTLFRDLDINQEFYLEPDPSLPKHTKVSGGKAMREYDTLKFKLNHIVFYK